MSDFKNKLEKLFDGPHFKFQDHVISPKVKTDFDKAYEKEASKPEYQERVDKIQPGKEEALRQELTKINKEIHMKLHKNEAFQGFDIDNVAKLAKLLKRYDNKMFNTDEKRDFKTGEDKPDLKIKGTK